MAPISESSGVIDRPFDSQAPRTRVIMAPGGDRPLILQKAGGLQGVFSYVAFAPARGIGVCAAVNAFDVAAGLAMAKAANDLIVELAPR